MTYHVDTTKSQSRQIELSGKIRKEQEEEEELVVLSYLWDLGEMNTAPKIFDLEILFKEKFGYKTYREAKERVKRTLNSLKNMGYLIKSPEEVHSFIRPSVEEFMRDAGLLATTEKDLYWLTINELKVKCRSRGLPDAGNKEDLIRRLK